MISSHAVTSVFVRHCYSCQSFFINPGQSVQYWILLRMMGLITETVGAIPLGLVQMLAFGI